MQLVMLTSRQNLTISLGVATMQAEMATNYGLIMAGARSCCCANRNGLPSVPKILHTRYYHGSGQRISRLRWTNDSCVQMRFSRPRGAGFCVLHTSSSRLGRHQLLPLSCRRTVERNTMIFDDLKNITFYKGIHPNLDQAIDFLYEHRKDSFELGDTILMEIRSFSSFKKIPSTKKKMIALSITKICRFAFVGRRA